MDFFTHQEQARRQTARLVLFFILAVALLIAGVYFAVLFLALPTVAPSVTILEHMEENVTLWNPNLFMSVAIGVGGVILIGSLYKSWELGKGGKHVAIALGGRLISAETTDIDERRALNVVEEMAIAAGLTPPPVYLLDNEAGINAFAAGLTPRDAVIGLTRGTVEQLSRDELQGVVAHEFSHILNGDMALNLRLIGVVHGILLIALTGRVMMETARQIREKEGYIALLLGVGLFIVGYAGVLLGRLIKAAVSRQREFLADASAVQFTRNPAGIAGALKKIGGFARITHPRAEEMSHLFFGEALTNHLGSPFATHPPLAERIQRLDPGFTAPATDSPWGSPAHESRFSDQVGTLTPENVAQAQTLLHGVPEELLAGTRKPHFAKALIYALLIAGPQETRQSQIRLVRDEEGGTLVETMAGCHAALRGIDHGNRLPLAELALTGLRGMPRGDFFRFRTVVTGLIESDQVVSLFEFALGKVVMDPLAAHFQEGRPPTPSRGNEQEALGLLLSTLATAGSADNNQRRTAFQAGAARVPARWIVTQTPAGTNLAHLDHALATLRRLPPAHKRQVVDACAACVIVDRHVTPEEHDLLRAVCATLDCPMPLQASGIRNQGED